MYWSKSSLAWLHVKPGTILYLLGSMRTPPGQSSHTFGASEASHEQNAEISKDPALSCSEGQSSAESCDAKNSYSRQVVSGNSGDRRFGVGERPPLSHKKHCWGALAQPHHDAVFRNSLHSSESAGTSRTELSAQVLSRPGIILSGKPTSSPKGHRLHESWACTKVAVSPTATKGSIDSWVGLIVNSRNVDVKVENIVCGWNLKDTFWQILRNWRKLSSVFGRLANNWLMQT